MPTYTARWVLPVAGPPLAGGRLIVDDDRIAAVEPAGPADHDLGNVALIPGLVNAHTHLDLSGARGRTPPTDAAHFTDWLQSVIAFRRSRTQDEVQADVRAGLAECLAAGTTLLGDITAGGASWRPLRSARGVRAVVFREVIGLGADWQDAYFNAHAWLGRRRPTRRCRPALSPHAPYTVRHMLFATLAARCREARVPSATHLAESAAEVELIERGGGPFVPFLAGFGFTDLDGLVASFRAVTAPDLGDVPQLLAHCNHLPADFSFAPNQSVVYCPRTHAAFGHPPHPFRDFLARGVRVCLGTDGLTSNPDLDILEEARFVWERYPDFPGDQLLRMVTLSGAEALGWADECGSLEPGKSADFVAVPLPARDGEVYELLFGADQGPRRTWFRGEERA